MDGSYIVQKVLNNNVIIATDRTLKEVVLFGKGIGFGKKPKEHLTDEQVEKIFVLSNEKEYEMYKNLLPQLSDEFLDVMDKCMKLVKQRLKMPILEHIIIALTDHIWFAIKRIELGIEIENPFLEETKQRYPLEFDVAKEVVDLLNMKLNAHLPKEEIGFIALHIHSAVIDKQ